MDEKTLFALLGNIVLQLERIADALQSTEAPNYKRALADYPVFDWDSISAEVVAHDNYGATVVRWRSNEYKRRTNPKFGKTIWFSRACGRSDDGAIAYERLVTFDEQSKPEPLPNAVADRLPIVRKKPRKPETNRPVNDIRF